jgi:RNA polymerase sigma-70 factor (ECF subfamily)
MQFTRQEWENLIEKHSSLLLGITMGVLGNIEDSKDICQETFIEFFKASSLESPRSWLCKVAFNKAVNLKKKNKSHQQKEISLQKELNGYEDPLSSLQQEEDSNCILQGIEDLSEGQKMAVLLRYQAEMAIKEIADVMSVSEGTVKKHLSRALNHLKEKLNRSDVHE